MEVQTPCKTPISPARSNEMAMLTETEAAELLNVSVRTLQGWRVRGGGPKFCRYSRLVRYVRADLLAFIEARRVSSTSEASPGK